MGFGRDMMGGEVTKSDLAHVESQVRQMRNVMRRGENQDRSQERQLKELRRENDALKLYLAALIRILISRGVISETEIERITRIIDAEDGDEDGRMDGEIV